jgi:hypothetical protein
MVVNYPNSISMHRQPRDVVAWTRPEIPLLLDFISLTICLRLCFSGPEIDFIKFHAISILRRLGETIVTCFQTR